MGTRPLVTDSTVIEEVLGQHRAGIGVCFADYRCHAYRMLNFVRYLVPAEPGRDERAAVAAAFHDLPALLDWNLDYTGRAADMADRYLAQAGHSRWSAQVRAMIENHHKVTPYRGKGAALVEATRTADWIDVSFGALRFGIPRGFVREVQAAFPVTRLRRHAVPRIAAYAVRHPRRPFPFMRW